MINESLTCPQCGKKYDPPADRCPDDGAPLYGPEVMERLGSEIGNYKVIDILGEGGMGVVYRGEHIMLAKPVAMKILHDRFAKRKGAATQFLREARAASRIRHPNIVDVTDFGKAEDGSIYFVMEYLEGESLEDVLARDTRIELFTAVNVVNQIARALSAAHDHGIIHQDLKPDNIYLIAREGRRRIVRKKDELTGDDFIVEHEGLFEFVKLLDFGVAKFNEDNLGPGLTAKTGMVFGTPHYMSPEQAQGLPVDPRSDVYSLGILFYEMLLGVVPFDSDSALEILNGHVSGKVRPPKDADAQINIDDATNETILRCLAKDPKERFRDMDALCLALRDCFTDRVYLRDAARLPGAVEAGIVAPTTPARPPEAPSRQPSELVPGARKKRLTDELGELFSAPAGVDVEDLITGEHRTVPSRQEAPVAYSDPAAAVPLSTVKTTPGLVEEKKNKTSPGMAGAKNGQGDPAPATSDPAPRGGTQIGHTAIKIPPEQKKPRDRKRRATATIGSKAGKN